MIFSECSKKWRTLSWTKVSSYSSPFLQTDRMIDRSMEITIYFLHSTFSVRRSKSRELSSFYFLSINKLWVLSSIPFFTLFLVACGVHSHQHTTLHSIHLLGIWSFGSTSTGSGHYCAMKRLSFSPNNDWFIKKFTWGPWLQFINPQFTHFNSFHMKGRPQLSPLHRIRANSLW